MSCGRQPGPGSHTVGHDDTAQKAWWAGESETKRRGNGNASETQSGMDGRAAAEGEAGRARGWLRVRSRQVNMAMVGGRGGAPRTPSEVQTHSSVWGHGKESANTLLTEGVGGWIHEHPWVHRVAPA